MWHAFLRDIKWSTTNYINIEENRRQGKKGTTSNKLNWQIIKLINLIYKNISLETIKEHVKHLDVGSREESNLQNDIEET